MNSLPADKGILHFPLLFSPVDKREFARLRLEAIAAAFSIPTGRPNNGLPSVWAEKAPHPPLTGHLPLKGKAFGARGYRSPCLPLEGKVAERSEVG